MAYQKHDHNSCCFSKLASALKESKTFAAVNAIATRIHSLLTCEILDGVEFSNAIMVDKAIKKDSKIYIINWKNGRKLSLLIF